MLRGNFIEKKIGLSEKEKMCLTRRYVVHACSAFHMCCEGILYKKKITLKYSLRLIFDAVIFLEKFGYLMGCRINKLFLFLLNF